MFVAYSLSPGLEDVATLCSFVALLLAMTKEKSTPPLAIVPQPQNDS